ncbi:hypothetical protein HW132_34455 [Brasilonema sp. CT11]|nr:hypothetical protein [Brasilonema sp. CT11]
MRRRKLEWVYNDLQEHFNQKTTEGFQFVELETESFDIVYFVQNMLPPKGCGYDDAKNQTIYLLYDLVKLFFYNSNQKYLHLLIRKIDSWNIDFVVENPTR